MDPHPTPTTEPAGTAAGARPVVLVTGGAQRIGRVIALELARAGWRVALHYRHSADAAARTLAELRAAGAEASAFATDLADEAQCEALVPAVLSHFGRLDALVNNASLFELDDVASFGFAAMDRHWRANTAAPIVLARALQRARAVAPAPPGGRVVVNLLDQKLWNPNPDHLSYTLSKAALEAANTMLAIALAPSVRVCAVAPGVTLLSGEMSGPEFDASHRMTPLGRGSSPEDVARAVRFLLESPAITGTTLLVDGGQHLAAQRRDVMFLVREAAPGGATT
jgi:NAD(P)-dependent dehydrogenase (short-subunit alcohol dehydrogenase family)